MEWQPIETAPAGKGDLSLYSAKDNIQFCGRYRSGAKGEPQQKWVAWRSSCSGMILDPSHWRRLQDPPSNA